MLDQVAAAFDRQDYKTAAQLLRQLSQQSPDNPWVWFYTGRLHEVSGKVEAAAAAYRKLLQETTNPKIAFQARQGLQRLDEITKERRREAIAHATTDASNNETGFLVLESMKGELHQSIIQVFARIMGLDPYTARIHLSHRSWRLYRVGAMGELQVYGRELREAGIPALWVPLSQIRAIRVFQVHYLQTGSPQPTVVCHNETRQLGSLAFDWTEVRQQVEGTLPIFEEVVDLGPWNKLKRKEQTQDYAQMLDLHLPGRNCILRFCDRTYQFQQGLSFNPAASEQRPRVQATTRMNWINLKNFLQTHLPNVPVWSEFTAFGETALEHLEMMELPPHIALFRRAETKWDPAFHLYSGLIWHHLTKE
jgi:hypothetical protein